MALSLSPFDSLYYSQLEGIIYKLIFKVLFHYAITDADIYYKGSLNS
jgi:hypothetical protein